MIKIKVLRKVFSKQLCFIRRTSQDLRVVDLPLTFAENISSISSKVPGANFMGSHGIAYASLAASRALLQQLLACLNFTSDSEDLFCCYKRKN